jgi:hypothetical protein
MKQLLLLAIFATAAPAATHRVCWITDPGQTTHCGEPLGKKAADEFVAQATAESPKMHYWVATEANPAGWNRARLVATGVALAAGIYDAHTTTNVLAAGGIEQNPLYGSHPSAARLYGTNIGAVMGPFILAEWWRHRHPEAAATLDKAGFATALIGAGVHLGAGVHNESVLKEQKSLQGR